MNFLEGTKNCKHEAKMEIGKILTSVIKGPVVTDEVLLVSDGISSRLTQCASCGKVIIEKI